MSRSSTVIKGLMAVLLLAVVLLAYDAMKHRAHAASLEQQVPPVSICSANCANYNSLLT